MQQGVGDDYAGFVVCIQIYIGGVKSQYENSSEHQIHVSWK